MLEKFKTFLKEHKLTILISAGVSALTVLLLIGVMVFAVWKSGSLTGLKLVLERMAGVKENAAVELDAAAKESTVVTIVEKASPAVVSIVVTKDVPIIEQYYREFNPFNDDFFKDFFGDNFLFQIPEQRQKGTEKKEVGGGSGFFVSADGYVVTNKHVVDDETAEYTVITNEGKKYPAKVLAKDSTLDVAVLKVKGDNFPYLLFGDSNNLKVGQTVIAIGNALAEFRNSVSVGIISGLFRSIVASDTTGNAERLEGVIQTDAAINPGNSGGPLLDLSGKVIGVNVAVQRGAENIGFALPARTVKNIVESVREYGEIVKPYLGVRYIQVTESVKKENNLPVDYGALISRGESKEEVAVIPGSPADKAGLRENDIILEVDGIKVDAKNPLVLLIRDKKIGQTVTLKVLSKGEEKEIKVTLEKAPKGI